MEHSRITARGNLQEWKNVTIVVSERLSVIVPILVRIFFGQVP